LSIIAIIGIILLIGIRKEKCDSDDRFRRAGRKEEGAPPDQAIYRAALMRFRPIMMTTMARCSAHCRWRSAPAQAPKSASRSASPLSAA